MIPSERHQYRERARIQALNWAQGSSRHNEVDNECCPDFSCCNPDLFEADQAARWATYHRLYGQQN